MFAAVDLPSAFLLDAAVFASGVVTISPGLAVPEDRGLNGEGPDGSQVPRFWRRTCTCKRMEWQRSML